MDERVSCRDIRACVICETNKFRIFNMDHEKEKQIAIELFVGFGVAILTYKAFFKLDELHMADKK